MKDFKLPDLIIMLSGLFIGLYVITFNIIGIDFNYFPGDLADGRLNLYFLEHAYQFLTGQISSLWNAPFMFPEKEVLAYSDNLLGSAPLYSFYRLIGAGTFKAYQLWFITVSALNYLSAFLFLKYIFKNSYAAVLGAFVFAFSIALQSQIAHAQTFPRFAIPLTFLMLVKFGDNLNNPKYYFFSFLFLVYEFYCGIYLGFMLLVPFGIYLLLVLRNAYSLKILFNKRWLFKIILYSIINVLLLFALVYNYLGRNTSASLEKYMEISETIPTIKSYFFSIRGSIFWNFLDKMGNDYSAYWDHQIFTGGISTLCSLLVIIGVLYQFVFKKEARKFQNKTLVYLFLTGIITFFFYLRFSKLISLYFILYFVPGFSAMRSIARIINIELLFFSIATSFVFARIFNHYKKIEIVLFIVSLILLLGDNYLYKGESYRTLVASSNQRTQLLESAFSKIPKGSVVSYEPAYLETSPSYYQLDAMLTAQKYGLKTINGYTGNCPGDYTLFWHQLSSDARCNWLTDKDIPQDSIYVVDQNGSLRLFPTCKLDQNQKEQKELARVINIIKQDKDWFNLVKKKAVERNISIDSMLILDAKWMIESKK